MSSLYLYSPLISCTNVIVLADTEPHTLYVTSKHLDKLKGKS